MADEILRTAQVIDDADPDELSRVKVRVFPELKDVQESLLPWAKPQLGSYGTGEDHGAHTPPEIGSFVVVRVKNNWKSFYYAGDEYVEGFAIYSKWSDISGDLESYGSDSYPQPRMLVGRDGTIRFHNTETGAIGIYHTTGTFVMINPDGQVRIKVDDVVQINQGAEKFVTYTAMNDAISTIMEALVGHTHADPVSGGLPTDPAFNATKVQVDQTLLEENATMKNIISD